MTVITTFLAGMSVCQIVPIEAEESTYTASIEEDTGTLNVEASAPDDVLPSSAQLVVSPIQNDGTNSLYEDTLNKLNEQASKDKKIIDAFYAYDIQFEDNDKSVEPDDGYVSVSMKWDTALKPEGVQDDDQVSVVHLTSDDDIKDLTAETDTDKSHASVKMDENDKEAVSEASIISDSFSVYALVWSRDDISSVKVHYIDEGSAEISDQNTVDINQETNTDSLALNIDNYTYAYALTDNVKTESLNIENGRLYYYDGTNWNQASSDDLYLVYTSDSNDTEITDQTDDSSSQQDSSTPEETVTPDNTEETQAPAQVTTNTENTQSEDTNQKVLTASVDNYNVTVTYGDDAGLPEDTKLSVKSLSSSDDSYKNAKKAVASSEDTDADNLEMDALDITLLDKDGNKIEPKDNSKVKVSISAADLPDTVSSIDIHHITENENKSSDTLLGKIVGLFKNNDADTAEAVKKNVTVTNGQAVTDFEVSSFSTFTITWTKGDGTRVGNVVLHYIKDTGLEKDVTNESVSSSDLTKYYGGIVDFTSSGPWQKELESDTNSSGNPITYTFDRAVIGDRTEGPTITGVKIEQGTETKQVQTDYDYTNHTPVYTDVEVTNYKLYYTSDLTVNADSNWTLYRDSASGNTANNADIFLIYRSGAAQQDDPTEVTFHHVDKYGAKLANDTTDGFGFVNKNGTSNISAFTDGWNGSSNNATTGSVGKRHHPEGNVDVGSYVQSYIGIFGDSNMVMDGGLYYKKDSATGTWHTGTGAFSGSRNSNGSHTSVTKSLSDTLYTDIYNVYSDKKGVTIHYIDENGNEINTTAGTAISSGSAYTPASVSIDGYTYKEARLTGINGSVFTDITYTVESNGDWTSTVSNNNTAVETSDNPVNDVYLVYTKNAVTKTLTAHYSYENATPESVDVSASDYDNAYYRDGDSKKNEASLEVTNGETQLVRHQNENYEYVFEDIVKEGQIKRAAKSGETGDSNGDMPLVYANTHVGSTDGPTVTSVEVSDDGTLIYHTDFSGSMTPNTTDHNWTYTEINGTQKGRRFVLTVDASGNPSLQDSQNGSINLNYATEAGGQESDGTSQQPTYTATFHGEKVTTEYTVHYTPASGNTVASYRLEARDSFPSTNTDLYYVYEDDDQTGSGSGIWIDNDILYSGLFRARVSDQVQAELQTATNKEYRWYQKKVSTGTTVDNTTIQTSPGTEVTWKQTGEHQNTAQNLANRVFLDIEADEGTETWTYGTDVYYYVTLTYTPKDSSESVTISSEPEKVGYYGQLENGDFENTGAQSWKQSTYLEQGGVWKTTAPGADNTLKSGTTDKDIEIVNGTSRDNLITSYHWNGYKAGNSGNHSSRGDYDNVGDQAGWEAAGDASENSWAQHGNMFAELNAENAGALYQDVITHPNEELSYHFSHRARGSTEADSKNWHYDRMYLVIMPTKLAMTAGDNETELATQDELKKFIQEHGGFDESVATETEDEITYRNVDNGILIRKVATDESAWHTIVSVNSYIAKGGLTRFFFVAASECSDAGRYAAHSNMKQFSIPTEGNFLDNVGFSQTLPTPEGFSLVATKTFTGLTQSQIADLASSKTENGTTTTNDSPFTFTITNSYMQDGKTKTNDALSNAVLRFTAVNTGSGTYNFVGTATQYFHNTNTSATSEEEKTWVVIKESDYLTNKSDTDNYKAESLLNDKNTFVSRVNTNGTVTMTWTFTDQDLPVSGSTALDTNYTVTESNDTVAGYTVNPEVTATTGQTWRQAATAIMSGSGSGITITGSTINGSEGLTDVATDTDYVPAESVNLMIGQVSNDARTGYLVWTHTANAPSTNEQKQKIIEYINKLSWTKKVTAVINAGYGTDGHVEFVSGGNDGKPFMYDSSNPSLTISFVMNGSIPTVRFNNAVATMGEYATRTIRDSYVGRYSFNNTYVEQTSPQITVQKVFTGVTRSTVDDLLKGTSGNGYQITLKKTQTDTGTDIAEADQPSIVLNPQTSSSYSNVTYSTVTDEQNGKITLTWVIKEVAPATAFSNGDNLIGGPGTYSISEENYSTTALSNGDNNVLQYVTVNDSILTGVTTTSKDAITQTNIHVGKVGETDYSPTIKYETNDTKKADSVTSGTEITGLSKATNLIIAATSNNEYVVWTPNAAGANLRQAILNKINELWNSGAGATAATMDKISFRSGSNPGAMEYSDAHSGTIMNYNSNASEDSASLTFTNETAASPVTWTKYFVTVYTLTNGTDGEMKTNDTEIRIANSYDPLVKIKKVSETLDGNALEGAKFRLYKLDSSGNKLYYTTKSTPTEPDFKQVDVSIEENTAATRIGSDSARSKEVKALSFTSGANDGIVTIGALSREKGTNGKHKDTIYYLEEYEAPAGYNRVQIKFRVKDDGTVQLIDSTKSDNAQYVSATKDAQVSWDDPYYMLTIVDKAGFVLPVTGGTGIALFTMAGALLIAIAGVLFAKKKVNENMHKLQKQ